MCGSFNSYRSHRLMLECLSTESDIMRRCSFVNVGIVLLVEVCHCGGRFVDFLCISYIQCGTWLSAVCGSRRRTFSSFASIMSAWTLPYFPPR